MAMARVWCFLSRIALHGVSVLLHCHQEAFRRPTHLMAKCIVAVCKYYLAVNRIFWPCPRRNVPQSDQITLIQ